MEMEREKSEERTVEAIGTIAIAAAKRQQPRLEGCCARSTARGLAHSAAQMATVAAAALAAAVWARRLSDRHARPPEAPTATLAAFAWRGN